ncbi:MAG: carboxypeptidase-like regulatory domain-containing protein [Bacteroidales bacterium]|nr:carboxypeptidase-like regulatory domain-containing protein [Bacteroidales bacterium]
MKTIYSYFTFFIPFIFTQFVLCQKYTGIVSNDKNLPIEYVNIGIINKNVGTVSDQNGNFTIVLDTQYENDTIVFSCIGYQPFLIKFSDFKNQYKKDVVLKEKVFELSEVTVKPKVYKYKRLGVTSQSKSIQAGFKENQLGYECGIIIKLNKKASLEKLIINVASCSYDSIFYRVNIYSIKGKMNFENILKQPIYISLAKEDIKDKIELDLRKYDITVRNDVLITLEHVKDLGPGHLFFCAGMSKTYYRKTSQGKWETAPIGISLSVDTKVEK